MYILFRDESLPMSTKGIHFARFKLRGKPFRGNVLVITKDTSKINVFTV